MMSPVKPIILIVGPTAGGKTTLAIKLAQTLPGKDFGGECVCADSMQIYHEMDIGTAKPTSEEQIQAPHHLINIADPAEDGFSVDRWLLSAEGVIAEILRRNRYPIVVGGTNLYIQALLKGMFDGPEPDPALRSRLEEMDNDALRERLLRVDPEAAQRIHINDRKRTIRAIEVFELTGQTLSSLQQQWQNDSSGEDFIIVGLDWPVEIINQRINARVRQMIDQGLVEEVKNLWSHQKLGRQAREALGYKQIISHLEGKFSLDEAVEQIKICTRRFAKQQRTWLRRFRTYPGSLWLPAHELKSQDVVDKILKKLDQATKNEMNST